MSYRSFETDPVLNQTLQLSRLWNRILLHCFYAVYFSDNLNGSDGHTGHTSPLRFTVHMVQCIESKNWFSLSFRCPVNQLSWILLPEFSHGSMERVRKPAKFPGRDRHICPLEVFTNTYFSALTMQEIWHFISRERLLIHLNFRYRLGGDVHQIYSVSALQTREKHCVL